MIYYSNHPLEEVKKDKPLLFLAGSIDIQLLGNWRKSVANSLGDGYHFLDPTALNYQSMVESDWDKHVSWEFKAMELSDIILLNFLPDSQSPISLVELGLNIKLKKLIVVCPIQFYKNKYIKLLCNYYSTPCFESLEEALEFLKHP